MGIDNVLQADIGAGLGAHGDPEQSGVDDLPLGVVVQDDFFLVLGGDFPGFYVVGDEAAVVVIHFVQEGHLEKESVSFHDVQVLKAGIRQGALQGAGIVDNYLVNLAKAGDDGVLGHGDGEGKEVKEDVNPQGGGSHDYPGLYRLFQLPAPP